MTTPEATPYKGFYILPWLQLEESMEFGDIQLAPWNSLTIPDASTNTTIELMVGTYVGLGDTATLPSFAWKKGTDPLDVHEGDAESLLSHVRCLAFVAIANNQYCSDWTAPVTFAHFQAFYQRYQPGSTHTAILKRRRDGQMTDGWPLDRIRFTVPLAASMRPSLVVDSALLDLLAGGITSTDELDERIHSALPFFLMANQLSEQMPPLFDLVWLGSAFERLFNVSQGVGKQVGKDLNDLFSEYPQTAAPTWKDFRGNDQTGSWIQRWAAEFYDHRSSIHLNPPLSNLWTSLEHGLIATVVFSLAVKRLLEQAGRYVLTDADRLNLLALNDQVRRDGTGSFQDRWATALETARGETSRRSIAEAVENLPDSTTSGSDPTVE